MLLYRSHWRFAFERDPFGEARLLGFANGTADPQGTDTGASADNNPEGEKPLEQMNQEELLRELVRNSRKQAQAAVERPAQPVSGAARGEEPETAPQTPEEIQAKQAHQQKDMKGKEVMRQKFQEVIEAAQKQLGTIKTLKAR